MATHGPVTRQTTGHGRQGQCPYCEAEFATGEGCTTSTIPFPDEVRVPAVRYGDENDQFAANEPRCPDCGVARGGYHHPFCEVERCPRCHGRLATCGCLDAGATMHR